MVSDIFQKVSVRVKKSVAQDYLLSPKAAKILPDMQAMVDFVSFHHRETMVGIIDNIVPIDFLREMQGLPRLSESDPPRQTLDTPMSSEDAMRMRTSHELLEFFMVGATLFNPSPDRDGLVQGMQTYRNFLLRIVSIRNTPLEELSPFEKFLKAEFPLPPDHNCVEAIRMLRMRLNAPYLRLANDPD